MMSKSETEPKRGRRARRDDDVVNNEDDGEGEHDEAGLGLIPVAIHDDVDRRDDENDVGSPNRTKGDRQDDDDDDDAVGHDGDEDDAEYRDARGLISLQRHRVVIPDDDDDYSDGPNCLDDLCSGWALFACYLIAAAGLAAGLYAVRTDAGRHFLGTGGGRGSDSGSGSGHGGQIGGGRFHHWGGVTRPPKPFPEQVLVRSGLYDADGGDFKNAAGRAAPYWEDVLDGWGKKAGKSLRTNSNSIVSNSSTAVVVETGGGGGGGWGPWKDADYWGPCFAPSRSSRPIDWPRVVDRESQRWHPGETYVKYARATDKTGGPRGQPPYGQCRPGFLVIGAGKCGTSSLYHYLSGHPRVLPAKEKQIHYFKYHPDESMKWYLSHFPDVTAFLGSGALMTGEASPGYLPYPKVVSLARRRMGSHEGEAPRIITLARDPLDRAYSSYRYNYVQPTLKMARKGRASGRYGAPKGKSDEYYMEHHLMTFEEMVTAELKVLRECLAPGGRGEMATRDGPNAREKWVRKEMARRSDSGDTLPPLIDMDGHCYGDRVSKAVPRAQWADIVAANPQKIVDVKNLHLVQSLLGRGLYALPLEWWYAAFPPEDLYLFCTEDLRDDTAGSVADLGSWLGLPEYDFVDVVAKGAFNVGGHKGYDKVTSWNETHKEETAAKIVPLSEEVRRDFLDFVRPFNDRLFQLTGRRCEGWNE